MFADLAGSTALGEQIDPESVRLVMDRYYAAMREVVEARGGRVVKFIGDGVMAVFGVPETSEDDAPRALDASLAMQESFTDIAEEITRERGVTVGLRVGVNTGEVIVSAGDDDVVGDAVNLAARLEHAAERGTVLAGEATWRLARGYAVFDAGTSLAVAGKTDPVRAYRLLSLHETDESRTNLVGRVAELEALAVAFDDAVVSGTARLATVLGAPGVGKTRLVAELERRLAHRATVLATRCTPGGGATLAPVAELLRAAAGIDETSDDDTIVRAVGALIPEDESERDRVVSSVSALLGTGTVATPEETLWAVRRLLEFAARRLPVVVVIDDIQWGAAMLLDLVDHLAEWTRAPVLLVALARPELRDARGSMVDGSRHIVVALEGLDRSATARLACELLATEALPSALLERLPESTGGNPLFLRELLRMLVDDETLVRDGGPWQLMVAPDAITLPPTIQSLLAARIDRLPADEQLLLERASIAGKEFPLGALRELLPATSGTVVSDLLESLRRKELVESDGTYWIDEPVYRFHHALIRDAAYRRVLRQTRAELHQRLARWLESKAGARVSDYEELIGFHLEQAYQQRRELGLDARGHELGREAGARLGLASERALERDDLSAAAVLAGRALACLPAGDRARADLLLVRCEAQLAMGEAAAAGEVIMELGTLSTNSPRLAAWHACFVGQLATLIDASQLRDTEARLSTIAQELIALGDSRGAAKAYTVQAATLSRLGRYGEVEAALDRALTSAREAGDRRVATAALAAAPIAAVWGPNPVPRAGGRCLDVVRLLRITSGSPAVEAASQRCQGLLEAFRGRAEAARRLVGAARAALEELGLEHALLETEFFAGLIELVLGDVDAACRHLRVAYAGLRALGVDVDAARAAALLARALLAGGNRDEADRLATDAERLGGDDLQSGIAWRGARAAILAIDGHATEAVAVAEEAVRLASGTDALVHHAEACLALASARRAAADESGAIQAARMAADLYAQKGATLLEESAHHLADPTTEARHATGAPSRAQQDLASSCIEVLTRWERLFAARDWDAIARAVTPDYVYEDRRTVVGTLEVGPHAHVHTMQILADQGGTRIGMTFRATRGDHLVLAIIGAEAPDDTSDLFASKMLAVMGSAGDQLASVTVFGLDDLDGAFAELDARYIAGEGAAHAHALDLVVGSLRAYNQRDWDTFRSHYESDMVVVDHRPAGWGTLRGIDAQIEMLQPMIEMVPDSHMTIDAIPAISASAILYSASVHGHDDAGGAVELAFHLLNRVGKHRVADLEIFPGPALADALIAFHSPGHALRNAATEAAERWARSMEQRDWEAMRALQAPGYTNDDHRSIINDQDIDVVAAHVAAADLGVTTVDVTPLAIRGERLLLARQTYRGANPASAFEVELLFVSEVDEQGRQVWSASYEPDDLENATNALEERYLTGEGAASAEQLRIAIAITDAYNARDWDTMGAFQAPNLVLIDHRPAAWGELHGRDAFIDAARRTIDLIPDVQMYFPVRSAHGRVLFGLLLATGTSQDGGPVELSYWTVAVFANGLVVHQEHFPLDTYEAASARVTELIERRSSPDASRRRLSQ